MSPPASAERRLLLVEDDPDDVEIISGALVESGRKVRVCVARDGIEAMDYLRGRKAYAGKNGDLPAAVLLDLKLPRLDGLAVLREMRGDQRLRLVPVVVLTSSRECRDIEAAYTAGANSYVVKPLTFKEMKAALSTLASFWGDVNQPPPGCCPKTD